MSLFASVRHGVDGKGHIEAKCIRQTGGGLDADACSNPGNNDLSHTFALQVSLKTGVRECIPGSLGHPVIFGVQIQFGSQISPIVRARPFAEGLFGPTGRGARDLDQNYWEVMLAASASQRYGVLHHCAHWMYAGMGENALLQIDNDQSGYWVEIAGGHWGYFSSWT